jgi:class 3 adenylate cyclase
MRQANQQHGSEPALSLRPWQRLSVKLACLLAAVTLCAVAAVGGLTYKRHQRELEDTVGTQLLNIARVTALAVDPALHAQVQRDLDSRSPAYLRIKRELLTIRNEVLLTTPIYTLADFDPATRKARLMVVSDGPGAPGELYHVPRELIDPMRWTFEDGVARYTEIYTNARGTWITAVAPILDRAGRPAAVVNVDYPVEIYLDRLQELRRTIFLASGLGAVGTLLLGFLVARRLTRPIRALTQGVMRVAAGNLSDAVPVRSKDEVGQLTRAFNQMLEGLRQRDFIRSAFGRYVSPEVAQALLESPEGLRFGGEKRIVTVLMSDLRGYTRFAERGEPTMVMEVLNGFLGRMTDIIIEHGGTINEFIGDAIFAVFGAPVEHLDHAERAAACALAMQHAMADINRNHATTGQPQFEMGIGLNTGEAVVGNIGSEQRAKYAVVGSAVNVAARVEGATVGGQVFITEATHGQIAQLAEVAEPILLDAKGLSEPLKLYELRSLRGRFAQSDAPDAATPGREVVVSLSMTCKIIDGKAVRAETIDGEVIRIAGHQLIARLTTGLDPLTNVRLRLRYSASGPESDDIYGKVVRADGESGERLARIHMTSTSDADAERLEALLR